MGGVGGAVVVVGGEEVRAVVRTKGVFCACETGAWLMLVAVVVVSARTWMAWLSECRRGDARLGLVEYLIVVAVVVGIEA